MMRQLSSSYKICWVLVAVTLLGVGLSSRLTTDTHWTSWHLSRLGEGGSLSALIFNATFLLAAILLLLVTRAVAREIARYVSRRRRMALIVLVASISLCWAGVGIFPFDQFPVIHNICGYGQFLLLAVAMVHLRRICPTFTERTYAIGALSVITTSLLLGLFHLMHMTTLLTVEIVGQICIYIWLLSLTHDSRSQYLKRASAPIEGSIRSLA